MGRINLKPVRVRQAASQLLQTPRLRTRPPWFDVLGSVPPTQALVRTQPVQLDDRPKRMRIKKPSKLFKPQRIEYQEDGLRRDFFGDHPWELARPRVVLEDDGKDEQRADWSRLGQVGKGTDGESVVQRQRWLMDNVPDMTLAKAYDQARREFYHVRHEEDVERRVAREEALSTGAYFGKSQLEIGMELEDNVYEQWKAWALKETMANQARVAAITGLDEESTAVTAEDPAVEAALVEVSDSVPSQGQRALGGAPVHP